MRIKIIKPYMLNATEKPVDKQLDVTNEFGNQLIADGYAIELKEVIVEVKKTKKIK